ncbi:MAG: hypothetical protein EPO22_07995 [Dehalococcoidia bacterium]|nr:MAG: hypothetical protein EPO22_07995 [Dehalococcoidia bacterium]
MEVTANGQLLDASTAGRFLSLAGRAVQVRFGVRGRMIGQRDLHAVQVDMRFGDGHLAFAYVPPGAVANFGLLFNTGHLGNWEYIEMFDPPGYAQDAYTVPPEFDRLMSDAGFRGAAQGEIIESRTVPLDQAQSTYGPDHIEVWRGDGPHVRVAIPDAYDSSTTCENGGCPTTNPAPPFSGDPLNVEIWPRGIDPFPDAVRPAELTYYPGDASGSRRGVLVQTRGGVEFNGTLGGALPPYYTDATMDGLLQEAARQLNQPRTRNDARAFAIGGTAVFFGVLAIAWTSWDAERKRRRSG